MVRMTAAATRVKEKTGTIKHFSLLHPAMEWSRPKGVQFHPVWPAVCLRAEGLKPLNLLKRQRVERARKPGDTVSISRPWQKRMSWDWTKNREGMIG